MPEQRRAVAELQAALRAGVEWTSVHQLVNMGRLPTGFRAFCAEPIKSTTLPRGNDWAWNQSSKSVTHTVNSVPIKLVKLSPRLRKNSGSNPQDGERKAPHLKVWVITINMNPQTYYIWVERGEDNIQAEKRSPLVMRSGAQAHGVAPPVSAHDIVARGFLGAPLQLPMWLPPPTVRPQTALTEQSLQFLGDWLPENMIVEDWEQTSL